MSRKKQKTFDKRDFNSETPENVTNVGKIVSSTLFSSPFWHKMDRIEQEMTRELSELSFPKEIVAIYNPLTYAHDIHCEFLDKFLNGTKKIVFLGMNPGFGGMAQTGVIYFLFES